MGKWADPGGTAMPGQSLTRPGQAPEPHPLTKISLISQGVHGPVTGIKLINHMLSYGKSNSFQSCFGPPLTCQPKLTV